MAEMMRNGWARRRLLAQEHVVFAMVVLFVVLAATIDSLLNKSQTASSPVWIVYGSAISFAAGRSGTRLSQGHRQADQGDRQDDRNG